MSINLNRVTLAGRLTADPTQPSPTANITKFSLAINRRWKSKDGEPKEETVFVDCDAFGTTAANCMRFLRKGAGVFVEGRLKLDKWQTQDGQKRQRLTIAAEHVQFLDRAPDQRQEDEHASEPTVPTRSAVDEEPPF